MVASTRAKKIAPKMRAQSKAKAAAKTRAKPRVARTKAPPPALDRPAIGELDRLAIGDLDRLDVDDDAAFGRVREEAARQLEREYHDTNTVWLYALARFGRSRTHGALARELVLGGFDRLIDVKRETPGRLINSVAYHALAFAALDLPPHPSIGPTLHRAFRVAAELTELDVHYDLNVACGPLAIALATLDHRDAIDDLARFRETFDHYDGTPFHAQVLYAQWMFASDGAGALAYLAESEQLKCLGWAAAALADLDHKPGRATIQDRLRDKLHAESREALLEANVRLSTQRRPPAPADRMIVLFGRVSPVEIALGEETDNVFRERAVARRAARAD